MAKKIAVPFTQDTLTLLTQYAQQEQKKVERLTHALVLEALNEREETALAKIAGRLDTEHVLTYGHTDAWE